MRAGINNHTMSVSAAPWLPNFQIGSAFLPEVGKQQTTNGQRLCLGFCRRQAILPPPIHAIAEGGKQSSLCRSRPTQGPKVSQGRTGIPRTRLRPKNARVAMQADARVYTPLKDSGERQLGVLTPVWSQAYEKACKQVKPIKEAANARYPNLTNLS